MTQQEFDEVDAVIVHLLTDDRQHAYCSGERIDAQRWADSDKPRKQCQACFHLVTRPT